MGRHEKKRATLRTPSLFSAVIIVSIFDCASNLEAKLDKVKCYRDDANGRLLLSYILVKQKCLAIIPGHGYGFSTSCTDVDETCYRCSHYEWGVVCCSRVQQADHDMAAEGKCQVSMVGSPSQRGPDWQGTDCKAIHKCSDRSNGPFVKVNCRNSCRFAGKMERLGINRARSSWFSSAIASRRR
jgi:hypothetical protein